MWIDPHASQIFNTHSEIRRAFPNVSFPALMTDEDIAAVGVWPLGQIAQPTVDRLTERVIPAAPALVDGAWQQQWHVQPLDVDERAVAAKALQAEIVAATQRRLDDFARTRGYDSVDSTSKYKDISDEEIAAMEAGESALVMKFRAEARYLAVAVARTWATLYIGLAKIDAGTNAMPTSYAAIEPLLPPLEWPV